MGTPAEEKVTFDVVSRCLAYDGQGGLVWIAKSSPSSPVIVGSQAGSSLNTGGRAYKVVNLKGQKILVHRIVWALHHRSWPSDKIDHIDGNSLNNRIENLREVSSSENSMNRSNRSDNRSGLKGARMRRKVDGSPVWTSSIWVDGKERYLGRFGSAEEAHRAYVNAANENYGSFARAA